MAGKCGDNVAVGRAPWEGHTYQSMCTCATLDGGSGEAMLGIWNGGITVNREPAYLAAPHPRCVVVGICQGSSLVGS